MKTNMPALALALAIVACGPTSPESARSKDIASDFGTIFTHFLYYRDGADVVQAACNSGTVLYDRASCSRSPRRVPAERFYRELQSEFGSEIEELGDRVAEAFVQVTMIDDKIFELLSSSGGGTPRPDLTEKVARKQAALQAATGDVVRLREQIALLQAALAARDDLDDRLQLAALETTMQAKITAVSTTRAELAALRQELAETGAPDGQAFRQLTAQRARAVEIWHSLQQRLGAEVDEASLLTSVLAMLEETYVHIEDTMLGSSTYLGVIMEFDDLFDELQQQPMRYRSVGTTTSTTLTVAVPFNGNVKSLQCRFESTAENRCLEVRVTSPAGEPGAMSNLYHHSRYAGWPTEHMNEMAKGTWTFELVPICGNPLPTLLRAPWCELGVD